MNHQCWLEEPHTLVCQPCYSIAMKRFSIRSIKHSIAGNNSKRNAQSKISYYSRNQTVGQRRGKAISMSVLRWGFWRTNQVMESYRVGVWERIGTRLTSSSNLIALRWMMGIGLAFGMTYTAVLLDRSPTELYLIASNKEALITDYMVWDYQMGDFSGLQLLKSWHTFETRACVCISGFVVLCKDKEEGTC